MFGRSRRMACQGHPCRRAAVLALKQALEALKQALAPCLSPELVMTRDSCYSAGAADNLQQLAL